MRINDIDEVVGVVVQADMTEGKFGLLCANAAGTYDFGSRANLPGIRVPATADEAEAARYCVTWQKDNRKPPYYVAQPDFGTSLRKGGFDQAANSPFSATVYMTYPGYTEGVDIPFGTPALGYAGGIVTIPSGDYIYAAGLTVMGAYVIVANTDEDTTDAGKAKVQATFDGRVIGTVEDYDTANGDLTIRLR